MELEALLDAAQLATSFPRQNIIETIDFINVLKHTEPVHTTKAVVPIDTSQPLDLLDELHYSYQVAKRLLTDELAKGNPDSDELRKNLTQISKFMESALKMQERLHSLQQMQRFQEAVFALLDTLDPTLRQQVIKLMLDSDL